jgi:hypothetical protein
MSKFFKNTVNFFSGFSPKSQFVTIHGYKSKESGEVADYSVVFGFNYSNAVKKSIKIIEETPTIVCDLFSEEISLKSKNDILLSLQETLSRGVGYNSAYTKQDYYEHILPGIKYSSQSDTLYMDCLKIHKRVIEKGVFKKVNSKPLTIAKNQYRSMLPISKIREFRLTEDSFKYLSLGGLTVSPDELI